MTPRTRSWSDPVRLATAAAALLTLSACATWQAPVDPSDAPLRARAIAESVRDVRLSAAILDAGDSRRMLGVDVTKGGVQPVWVEVENGTSHFLYLLRSGTDPDYFAPLEVAWSVHTTLGGSTNDRIDAHFDRMAFTNPIPPGTTRSGLLYTNPQPGTRVLNVDLLGNELLIPFTLFVPVPGEALARDIDPFFSYDAAEVTAYADLDSLRSALENLPCCAADADGAGGPAPVNLLLIGSLDDVAAALARRGYRRSNEPTDEQARLFGRAPGIVVQKRAQAGAPAVWMRLWRAPLTYQGQSVLAVQAGRPVGGRFLPQTSASVRMHPDVDEVRGTVILDTLYSGGLARVGFVTGVGAIPRQDVAEAALQPYFTDGLRAVLMFVERPLSLDEIEFLDWEPYSGRDPLPGDRTARDEVTPP